MRAIDVPAVTSRSLDERIRSQRSVDDDARPRLGDGTLLDPEIAMSALSISTHGLTTDEARARLTQYGANEIEADRPPSVWTMIIAQFNSALVLLLLGATALSAILGDARDAAAIAAILVVNAAIGAAQERRAERAMQALRKLAAPHARVVRDEIVVDVEAAAIVPGDVIVLEAGDVVAADAIVVDAHRLQTNEAALTGESEPVAKRVATDDAPDRIACVFAGTSVVDGTGRALVTATAMSTELGHIARLLRDAPKTETPLQTRLAHVGRVLLVLCIGVVAVVTLVGFARGTPPLELVMTSISLAVAAVPEGLPAIVTVALAIGVQRMAKQNVLIRRLPAVETLGCATVVCTDKTGTLTTGAMRVRDIWSTDKKRTLDVAAACCDADLARSTANGAIGDPTEIALLLEASNAGITRDVIEHERVRIETFPFDADRKRMSMYRAPGVLYAKGAVDSIVPLCTRGVEGALAANAAMASRGLRVLAIATGASREERDLDLVGLVGIADPPRPEAIDAVARAHRAGIETIMITGDQPATAAAIARELGIVDDGASDDVMREHVHARATPADKLAIVSELKARGAVVAMTGDGVNDAPALKAAHIGIAMGNGAEVTREAADMILVDENFASIVAAVREGRGVYDNIRKALVYLLGGNVGELLIVLCAPLAGAPLPFTALQLLWINLVTDGLPALALVFDPADPDVLERPPRPTDEPILGRTQWAAIAGVGALDCVVSLGVFLWALRTRDVDGARDLAFTTLVVSELLRAFAARSPTKIFPRTHMLSNALLLAVVVVTIALQMALHAFAFTRSLFALSVLSPADIVLTLVLGLVPVTVLELAKLTRLVVTRRSHGRPHESDATLTK